MKYSLLFVGMVAALIAVTPMEHVMAETPYSASVDLNVTNEYRVMRDYHSEKPLIIEAFRASSATGTIAIARIRDDRTNSLGSITLASSAGTWRQTNAIPTWLFRGDRLRFTHSGGATSSVLEIVGELSSPNQ